MFSALFVIRMFIVVISCDRMRQVVLGAIVVVLVASMVAVLCFAGFCGIHNICLVNLVQFVVVMAFVSVVLCLLLFSFVIFLKVVVFVAWFKLWCVGCCFYVFKVLLTDHVMYC